MTYEQLDYANEPTRRMMEALLRSAGGVTGFDGGKGRLLIEVFPAPEEGCVIYFTRLGEEAAGPVLPAFSPAPCSQNAADGLSVCRQR